MASCAAHVRSRPKVDSSPVSQSTPPTGTAGSALGLLQWARLGSEFRSIMKRAVLASILASILAGILLAGGAIAQIPPTDRRMISPRSIKLTAQQEYVIKENI